VNLAEVSGDSLAPGAVAEIYATAALAMRLIAPMSFHLFSRFFLGRARTVCTLKGTSVPLSMKWLLDPAGHRFFLEGTWTLEGEQTIFSSAGNEADPLAYVMQAFRENILEKALYSLVTPGYESDTIVGPNRGIDGEPHTSDTLQFTQLLNQCSTATGPSKDSCFAVGCSATHSTGIDEVSRWWSAIVSVGAHWLTGNDAAAERLYPLVDIFPKQLAETDDPLPRSVFLAFKARKNFLTGSKTMGNYSCIKQCNRAGELLRDSLNLKDIKHTQSSIREPVELLVCDWLLTTRTEVWQDEQTQAEDEPSQTACEAELLAFQHDLRALRSISQQLKPALPRVFLHEATARLMAGASPARTQQLLSRSLRRRNTNVKEEEKEYEDDGEPETGDREYATALLLACKHLPNPVLSSPGQRASMVAEAAKTYQKLGDRKALQNCRNMMMKYGSVMTPLTVKT